jgi:hypothetical protein
MAVVPSDVIVGVTVSASPPLIPTLVTPDRSMLAAQPEG